ncbi:MAG TPA: hypothetical protein VJ696_06550 [Rhodanobacteraceae bacterium]|nr:hypothetical protein [Rhodanobacteraceae bacterium]
MATARDETAQSNDQRPDAIQVLWLFRGSISIVCGSCALVAVFVLRHWQLSLLVAIAGLGFGTSDLWFALSTMAEDRRRRLTSPARVESAGHGLGWDSREREDGRASRPHRRKSRGDSS